MFVSIDIGGTKSRVASSKDLESIYKLKKFDTPKDFRQLRLALLETIVEICPGENIEGICVGIPGVLDYKLKSIKKVPNISYLDNKSFDSFFVDESLTKKVVFENDAYLAAYAESLVGAGADFDTVAYLTLSTGVGGALIENKKIPKYKRSFEPGHMIMEYTSRVKDMTGIKGTMESLLGGKYFKHNYGKDPVTCKDHSIWEDYGKKLAAGILNISVLWNPEVVVLGGSVSNKYKYFHPTLKVELNKHHEAIKIPAIQKSKLMDDAGLMGGFFYFDQVAGKKGK